MSFKLLTRYEGKDAAVTSDDYAGGYDTIPSLHDMEEELADIVVVDLQNKKVMIVRGELNSKLRGAVEKLLDVPNFFGYYEDIPSNQVGVEDIVKARDDDEAKALWSSTLSRRIERNPGAAYGFMNRSTGKVVNISDQRIDPNFISQLVQERVDQMFSIDIVPRPQQSVVQ